MNHANLLFSKIIDENNIAALTRYNISESDLVTEGERQVLRFITEYAEQNGGATPSYATVTAECQAFDYTPMVSDSYEYLTRQIKEHSAQVEFAKFVNDGELLKLFEQVGEKNMPEFIERLQSRLESIKLRTSVRNKIGTDVKADGNKFLEEYDRRKAGESFRIWKSKFAFINERIGGYVSSNVYTVYGKSGRGKSVITLEEAIEAGFQGANVLIWAMEMGWYEVMVRIYTSISARRGLLTTQVNGIDMTAGFDSAEIRTGQLNDEFDTAFRVFVWDLNEQLPGSITVRAVDDEDFNRRDLRALESDILQTKADVVVIDPFYYLDYESNSSKTAGGDAANTSMKLRRLAGRTHTVIFAITQAEEGKEDKDEDGNRELKLPDRADVKKTKALLEDASLLIAVDTDNEQGRGLIGLNKGRDGGEGLSAEIIYIPQVGIVKQPESGAEVASQFAF